jgi:putative selenium metabolism hydrolase
MSLSFSLSETEKQEVIAFAQSLVQIQSYSGQEAQVIKVIAEKMLALGYEEVKIDGMGNVLGRIGNGNKSILFDAHVDTVQVLDEADWDFPPFGGQVVDNQLQGRGSVDMKSAAAAAIYAGAYAQKANFIQNKTVYVSCTVFEEDCDGENLKHLFKEIRLRPDYVIICEPSNNKITLGHKGKAQIAIKTQGISAHGAAPEKGLNAVYEMAEIIQRVAELNKNLPVKEGRKGTLILSRIKSKSASLNAVPSECEIYLDRRMVVGETQEMVIQEIEQLIEGKAATWEIGVLKRTAWTQLPIHYEPFHMAWKIEENHPLCQACVKAYKSYFKTTKVDFDFWDFSTNAVTPVSLGIPTIGFGPGDYKQAHMRNESCPVDEITDACAFYSTLINQI